MSSTIRVGHLQLQHCLPRDETDQIWLKGVNKFCWFFVQAPNENGEESDSDDDSMDEDEQGLPSSSGQQDMSMELDPPASKASGQPERPSTLTQEEMADGWQEAPARRKGRGGKRT